MGDTYFDLKLIETELWLRERESTIAMIYGVRDTVRIVFNMIFWFIENDYF